MEAGELLKRHGLLNDSQLGQLRQATATVRRWWKRRWRWGTSTRKRRCALGEEVGLDYVDLRDIDVDLSLLKGFPHKLIHRQSLFPIRRDNGQLVVATSDPFDLYPIDEVSAATGLSVVPVLASRIRSAADQEALGRGQRDG